LEKIQLNFIEVVFPESNRYNKNTRKWVGLNVGINI